MGHTRWKYKQPVIKSKVFVLRLLTAVVLSSCQQLNPAVISRPSESSDCRTIEHLAGETEVCGNPQRIVALGPYVLEHLLALNVQPIGYADHIEFHQGDYTKPIQQIPYLGEFITQPLVNVGSVSTPSIESILKIQPDLILGVEHERYETLAKIAPTVLLDRFDPEFSLRTTAQAVDRADRVDQVLADTEQFMASVRIQLTPVVATQPNVLVLLTSPQLQEIYLGGHESCYLPLEAMGFQLVYPPVVDDEDIEPWAPISLEILPQLNEADVVILLGYNFDNLQQLNGMERFADHQLSPLKQAWEENAIAQSLDASKAGHVYFIPTYVCSALSGSIGTELYLEELKDQLLAPRGK